MMKEYFEKLAIKCVEKGAFDLHLKVGQAPVVRFAGKIRRTSEQPLSVKQIDGIVSEILSEGDLASLQSKGHVDTLLDIPGHCRLRMNVFFQRGTLSISCRVVPITVPKLKDLGFPEDVQESIINLKSGLVLVTGATNSGKSTTLNSIVQEICTVQSVHVVTIEDPIEFKFPYFKNSLVNQRQVGSDAKSFVAGLNAALRQDPDIIVIGELRTLEAISTSLQAADTGHLVFSTLHTRSAAQTISRLINIFPSHQASAIQYAVANCLKLVISQMLMPSTDLKKRILAYELMPMHAGISHLIRTNRPHEIPNLLQTGQKYGCVTMQASIDRLVKAGTLLADDVPPQFRQKK